MADSGVGGAAASPADGGSPDCGAQPASGIPGELRCHTEGGSGQDEPLAGGPPSPIPGRSAGTDDRPFVYAQQLKDAATRWLQPGETNGESRLLETVVVEQFLEGLPAETGNWVRYHRPMDLGMAVTLAEDHLAVHSGGQGQAPLTTRPTPTPRRKPAAQPTGAPRMAAAPVPAALINFPFVPSPQQAPAAADAASNPQRAPQTSGQECWRWGRPGHTCRECPRTEVGQVVRVAGTPAPSPGPD
ncbi:zinc finger protein 444-like [Acanthochromis polyacanthus]|uniref:zinc finger protein 444-like n=1 Tax=Acanthochromis polyacanthus TaxID=80966 RepID=UPI002233F363|nr:zinc finger protein 444-like [Acanthochromis polyacanthus]